MVTVARFWLYRVPARLRRPLVALVVCVAGFVAFLVWPVLLLIVPGVFLVFFVGGMASAALEILGDRRRARSAAVSDHHRVAL